MRSVADRECFGDSRVINSACNELWLWHGTKPDTADILAELGARREGSRPLLVGFAAETSDPDTAGPAKLDAKGCDLIVEAVFEIVIQEIVKIER